MFLYFNNGGITSVFGFFMSSFASLLLISVDQKIICQNVICLEYIINNTIQSCIFTLLA